MSFVMQNAYFGKELWYTLTSDRQTPKLHIANADSPWP